MPDMFDETLRRLTKMGRGVRIPVSIPLDQDGYVDRICPSRECSAQFKILFEDLESKASEGVVYCPVCRHEAPLMQWNTPEQQHYIERSVLNQAGRLVGDALRVDAERFNREQPKSGFLRMTMSFKPGLSEFILPIRAAELMRQRFTCEACGCRYASVGAAFFCPACGHNSVITTFDTSVRAVRQLVESLDSVKEALRQSYSADAAQDAVRQVLENSLVKLAGAFQRLAEARFAALPQCAEVKYRRNVFQNMPESSELWRQHTGNGYEDMVTVSEFREISRLFQMRHLLSHREGIVDQDYIDRTGDTRYSEGQRVIVREQTVIAMADLVTKLAASLGEPE